MPAPEQVTLARVSDLARDDLRQVLEVVRREQMDPRQARRFLETVIPELGAKYESAASTVAADLYTAQRAERGLSAALPFEVQHAAPATVSRWEKLVGWGLGPAFDRLDWDAAFTLLEGGLHRTVADAHRRTTMRAAIDDPASKGWARVGRGSATCDFCKMLISRGDVYREYTVKFKSHDHCDCAAESRWETRENAEMKAWSASARTTRMKALDALDRRGRMDAHRARIREYTTYLREDGR